MDVVFGQVYSSSIDSAGAINSDTAYELGGQIALSSGGQRNIFCGLESGPAEANTCTGTTSLGFGTGTMMKRGNDNTIVGSESCMSLQVGSENTVIGSQACYSMSSGARNVILGKECAYHGNDINDNVAIGYQTKLESGTENSLTLGTTKAESNRFKISRLFFEENIPTVGSFFTYSPMSEQVKPTDIIDFPYLIRNNAGPRYTGDTEKYMDIAGNEEITQLFIDGMCVNVKLLIACELKFQTAMRLKIYNKMIEKDSNMVNIVMNRFYNQRTKNLTPILINNVTVGNGFVMFDLVNYSTNTSTDTAWCCSFNMQVLS